MPSNVVMRLSKTIHMQYSRYLYITTQVRVCTEQSCTEYFGSSVFANSWDRIVLFGLRSSEIFHQRISSVFGLRKLFISEDLRSSVFENFSLAKIFGLRYSDIFHKRRSSVFSIRELLEPNSTNIFLFDIQMNVCNKYIVLPSFLKSHFSTFWYS